VDRAVQPIADAVRCASCSGTIQGPQVPDDEFGLPTDEEIDPFARQGVLGMKVGWAPYTIVLSPDLLSSGGEDRRVLVDRHRGREDDAAS